MRLIACEFDQVGSMAPKFSPSQVRRLCPRQQIALCRQLKLSLAPDSESTVNVLVSGHNMMVWEFLYRPIPNSLMLSCKFLEKWEDITIMRTSSQQIACVRDT